MIYLCWKLELFKLNLMELWTIISLKFDDLKMFSHSYWNGMALKFFWHYHFIKSWLFWRISNQNEIDRMVSNHLSIQISLIIYTIFRHVCWKTIDRIFTDIIFILNVSVGRSLGKVCLLYFLLSAIKVWRVWQ